jgi:RNA polymerase sigma-70 factor (ECF subfamily)
VTRTPARRSPTKRSPESLPAARPREYPPGPEIASEDESARLLDALVDGARHGDAEAFARLYRRFHGPVFGYLLARIGNRIEAEDMAAEVFVEAARRVRSFSGSADAFAGWLFTIARHDLVDRGRAARRRTVEPVADLPDVERAPDPAEEVMEHLDADRVREAMSRLTMDQREVLMLKFAAGLTNEETAAAVGKPVGAVKSLQHRGLAALRRVLEEGR